MEEVLFECQERVNSYECDFHGLWKPAVIFQHLSEVAGRHASRLGVGFQTMFAQGFFWVLSRMKVRFLQFPHADEEVLIRSWPKTIQQKLFFVRDFEIVNDQSQPLVLATSAWLVISSTSRRMLPPQALHFTLPGLPERHALKEALEKLSFDENREERLRFPATYSMVDLQGHVNNARYVEWICDAFPMEMFQTNSIDWLQINYEHEVRSGEEVAVFMKNSAEDKKLWQLSGENLSAHTPAFTAQVHWCS